MNDIVVFILLTGGLILSMSLGKWLHNIYKNKIPFVKANFYFKRGKTEKALQILRCIDYKSYGDANTIGANLLEKTVQYVSEANNYNRYDILYCLFTVVDNLSNASVLVKKLYQALELEYVMNTQEVELFFGDMINNGALIFKQLKTGDDSYEYYMWLKYPERNFFENFIIKDFYYLFLLLYHKLNKRLYGYEEARELFLATLISGILDKRKHVQLRICGIQLLSDLTNDYIKYIISDNHYPQLLKLLSDEQDEQRVRIEMLKYLLDFNWMECSIKCSMENFCCLFVLNVASPIDSLSMMLKNFLKGLDKSSREVLRNHLKMTNQPTDIISLFDVFVGENSQLKLL